MQIDPTPVAGMPDWTAGWGQEDPDGDGLGDARDPCPDISGNDPRSEICNGLDDDCDGVSDEGVVCNTAPTLVDLAPTLGRLNLNGVWTTLASSALLPAGEVRLRFEVSGTKLRLYVNDGLVAQAINSRLSSGQVGIRAAAGAAVDDFDLALLA